MYTLPQEIEVLFILPALRRELSKELIKTYGITYEKTGKLLGITKAAVSQYISHKRAAKIRLHPKALERVKNCLLYTPDADEDSLRVVLGGHCMIPKKRHITN